MKNISEITFKQIFFTEIVWDSRIIHLAADFLKHSETKITNRVVFHLVDTGRIQWIQ